MVHYLRPDLLSKQASEMLITMREGCHQPIV